MDGRSEMEKFVSELEAVCEGMRDTVLDAAAQAIAKKEARLAIETVDMKEHTVGWRNNLNHRECQKTFCQEVKEWLATDFGDKVSLSVTEDCDRILFYGLIALDFRLEDCVSRISVKVLSHYTSPSSLSGSELHVE